MTATATSGDLFWITSRAAGTAAMVLASVTVGFGLIMSGRLVRGALRERRTLHELLSLSTLVAIAVHGLALLGDSYIHLTLRDIAVPLASTYQQLPTALGITAGWALATLGLAYYARGWIGPARSKQIHRFTLLAWAGALVHTFSEGTDAGKTWFVALILLSCAPALIALAARFGPTLIKLSDRAYDPLTRTADAER